MNLFARLHGFKPKPATPLTAAQQAEAASRVEATVAKLVSTPSTSSTTSMTAVSFTPSLTISTASSTSTLTPSSKESNTMSFLSTIGKDFKAVFSWLGSSKGQTTISAVETTVTGVVSAVNPAAGTALSTVENLFNAGLKQVLTIESVAAAAGEQNGTGVQKAAAVAAAVSPQASAFLVSLGVSAPTADQIQAVANIISTGLVSIGNALPADAAEAAALVPAKAA